MHEKSLTLAAPPRSFLERLDPRIKIACALAWAVCTVTIPGGCVALPAIYAGVLVALLALNRCNVGKFALRFTAALPAIALLCALLPFFQQGTVLWHWGAIEVTREGLLSAQRVATAATLCVGVISLVWATTSESDLVTGLKGVGMPGIFAGTIAFMLRYLHVLRPELHRLSDARAARTIGRRGSPLHSATNLVGAFFLRAHDRAERVADAMAARGYAGQWRVIHAHALRARDALLGAAFVGGVTVLRMVPWN